MRILVAAHHLLPRHRGGVEVQSARLAATLKALGHEVALVGCDDDPRGRTGALRSRELEGVPVFEVNHPRVVRVPEDSLDHPEILSSFEQVLDRFAPDLVHFHHLMYLGLRAAEAVKERGIPSLLTLHEYWLLCPRNGQMIREDRSLCERPEPEVCARCLETHRFGRSALEARILGLSSRVKALCGWNPQPLLKRGAQALRRRREPDLAGEKPLAMLDFLEVREQRVHEALARIDRLLSPSRFLADRFAVAGFEDAVIVSPNGVPLAAEPRVASDPPGAEHPLTLCYLGSIVPQKGLEILVEAVATLDIPLRLRVFGPLDFDPELVASLRRRAGKRIEFRGALPPGRAQEAFAGAHALVVPSLWYENAPLVISEAFASGVPVVASRLGGMAEMVRDGRDGLLFETGSVPDLQEALRRLGCEPGLWESLRDGVRPPRSLDDEARSLLRMYEDLLP